MDLDSKSVVRSVGDEMTLLPKKVQKALKTAINMCKIDSGERQIFFFEVFMQPCELFKVEFIVVGIV